MCLCVHIHTVNIYTIYIYIYMTERKQWNECGYLKLIRIKIRDLPADTVAQSAKRRRDKPNAWVRILASVIFYLFRCVLSTLLTWQSIGRSNFDRGLHNLVMLTQKQHTHKKITI